MHGYPQFSFWISIAPDMIYLSHIVIIWEKILPIITWLSLFRHVIGQFAVRNLLYGPKFQKPFAGSFFDKDQRRKDGNDFEKDTVPGSQNTPALH